MFFLNDNQNSDLTRKKNYILLILLLLKYNLFLS